MKYFTLLTFLFAPFIVFGAEVTYNNPTFGSFSTTTQPVGTNCIASDLIGNDENDGDSIDTISATFFCTTAGHDGLASFTMNSGTADPDVCEPNNDIAPTSWRFDTSATNNFTQIVCEDITTVIDGEDPTVFYDVRNSAFQFYRDWLFGWLFTGFIYGLFPFLIFFFFFRDIKRKM